MTFHSNRHDVIETDDITDVQHVQITQENGQKVAFIKAILDPRKDYQALKDIFLHLTNGINHRMLGPFEHGKPATTAEPTVGSEAPVASTESQGETTQPLSAPATAQPSEATTQPSTTEGSTDNSVSADTVELAAVTPSKGKGTN